MKKTGVASRPLPHAPRPLVADLLIEIGTEELPAHYVPPAIKQLEQLVPELFAAHRIAIGAVRVYGSPRRLAVIVNGVAARQQAQERQVRGPSKAASFDAKGQPTPALQGFLRKYQATVDDVAWPNDYAQLVQQEPEALVADVLAAVVPALIARLAFPKAMRWDDSGLTFARPIRWLIVLYGATPVRVKVGRLTANRTTYGHPAAGRKAIAIESPATYPAQLQHACVLIDQAARATLIQRLINDAADKQGGLIAPAALHHGLLDEVSFLTEDPHVLVGGCEPSLLVLPPEVVVASMSKHQRVFAVESRKDGRLLPMFILVLDSRPTQPARVRQFAERILNARLSDALVFWTQDTKTSLEAKVEQLQGIVFHAKLGTVYDKTQRVVALVDWLASQWTRERIDPAQLRRVALLAKADLVTAMVKEFPSLQGVIGRYYALESREAPSVAEAIGKHYAPEGNRLAEIVALADWFDTLTGYFGIGIEPTGSQDPFGLRRCALGISRILARTNSPLSIRAMTKRCVEAWGARLTVRPEALAARLETFFKERLASDVNLKEWVGEVRYDVVRAVLAGSCDDLCATMQRIRELGRMDGSAPFLQAASVVERTANILKGVKEPLGEVDPSQFVEPLERKLWEVYNSASPGIRKMVAAGDYRAATIEYATMFAGPIHAFFNGVLVNADDAAVRRNRLALLTRINRLYTADVADLSQVVTETRLTTGEGAGASAGRPRSTTRSSQCRK